MLRAASGSNPPLVYRKPGCAGCLSHGKSDVPGTCRGGLEGEGTGVGNLRTSGVFKGSRGRMLSGQGRGWESRSMSYPLLLSGPSLSGSPDGRPNPPRSSLLVQMIAAQPGSCAPPGGLPRHSAASDEACADTQPSAIMATSGHFRMIVPVFTATPSDQVAA